MLVVNTNIPTKISVPFAITPKRKLDTKVYASESFLVSTVAKGRVEIFRFLNEDRETTYHMLQRSVYVGEYTLTKKDGVKIISPLILSLEIELLGTDKDADFLVDNLEVIVKFKSRYFIGKRYIDTEAFAQGMRAISFLYWSPRGQDDYLLLGSDHNCPGDISQFELTLLLP